MAYFQTKRGSLEESIRKAVIKEASVTTDLDDDPKLFKQIERMGVKVKKHGKPQDGYQEVTLSGPQAKIDAANKKLNLLPEAKLDPVNPKAAAKKFKDRKDKDIDNDGDVDSSDEFLHKRRKAISKAMGEEISPDEYESIIETLAELSPALLRRARDAAQAKADKLGARQDKLSQKKGGGYNFKSKSGQKLSRDADKARDQQRRFEKGASDAAGREQEKADQKGVLGKKGTSAKSKEKERRRGLEPRGDSGRQKGSLAGVGRNVAKVDALYKKYRDGGGKLSKSDYLDKFGSRIKRENYDIGTPENTMAKLDATPGQSQDDWQRQVDTMQKKNASMREALAKVWGVGEGHNPFKTEDEHSPDEKKKKVKIDTKTMTGKPITKVEVDPDMREVKVGKKNVR